MSFICFTKSCCAKAALLKLLFHLSLWFAYSIGRANVCLPVEDDTDSLCPWTQKCCGTYRTWDCQTFVRGKFGQRCLYSKALILLFQDLIMPLTHWNKAFLLFYSTDGLINFFIKKEATWLGFLVINKEWTSLISFTTYWLQHRKQHISVTENTCVFITNIHPFITDNLKWSYLN